MHVATLVFVEEGRDLPGEGRFKDGVLRASRVALRHPAASDKSAKAV